MKNPQMAWAAVVVVFILVAGATTLAALDKDPTIVLTLAGLVAVPVLGAFGVAVYQKLDQVKELANGNSSDQMKMIKDLHEKVTNLALLVPSPAPKEVDKVSDDAQTVRFPDPSP